MATRLRLFVDFWNFQLDWNRLVGKTAESQPIPIPWKTSLPNVLRNAVSSTSGTSVAYAGTHVYASVDPDSDSGLRKFLHAMDSFPGYSVLVEERRPRPGTVHCRCCGKHFSRCPECSKPLRRTIEKGIDAAILTDMIQMAYDDVFDVAVLASNDADLCSGVRFIQDRLGKQVYLLWFPGVGHELRNACWSHFDVKALLDELGVSPGMRPPGRFGSS